MECVIIPLVKNKGGDLSNINNYRAVAMSNYISKLLEACILDLIRPKPSSNMDKYQFGFKAKHSTSLCTDVLKRTIDFYTNKGSYVFTCFVDLSKAFDEINY